MAVETRAHARESTLLTPLNPRPPAAVPLNSKRPPIVLLSAFLALAAYLYSAAPLDGDGAAYALQGLGGSATERAVHVGVLAPLWIWMKAGGPANAFALLWALAALIGVERLARSLVPEASASERLLAPAVLLGAAASWQAALFVEVYGPLATLAVWCVVGLRAGHWGAGLAFGWMVLVHPGAIALAPGLLLIGGRRPDRKTLAVAALPLLAWLALWPAPWVGERSLAALPAFDVSPWQSLQRAWRLLARDLGITAALVVAGSLAADRRAAGAVVLLAIGSAFGVDRYADNAGQLPALWVVCAFAPAALRWRPAGWSRGALAGAAAAIALLGVAEATSRHDRVRRQADRAFAAEAERCGEPTEDWGQRMRRTLACRAEGARTAATGR